MKRLHRADLYGWSVFDESRNIDFNSVLWVRAGGNVAIDPLPMTNHDRAHLASLGPLAIIVVTNSDHVRASRALSEATGARIVGPVAERDRLDCDAWIADGDEVVPGLEVFALEGSKTPGELALLLEQTTLITGDLIRAHEAGRLCLLPDAKLTDRASAITSLERIARLPALDAVLTGDGWPVFRGGAQALADLLAELRAVPKGTPP